MISQALKKIDIFAHKTDQDVLTILHKLHKLLDDYETCWETHTATIMEINDLKTVNADDLGRNSDLIIVVGGDGSMLRCVATAAKHKTPLIGINKGRLGFLTDIRPTELESRLLPVLDGHYWIGQRSLLNAEVHYPNQKIDSCNLSLNDVILYPGETPHMLEFEVYVNDIFLCSHRADGLIISTPTGSTAYNLSAGGPIVHPELEALVLLPMFSHTLTARPILIPNNQAIRLEFSKQNEINGKLSADADKIIDVTPGSNIFIKQSPDKISLLHPNDYDYYESLRSKLYWGQRLTD